MDTIAKITDGFLVPLAKIVETDTDHPNLAFDERQKRIWGGNQSFFTGGSDDKIREVYELLDKFDSINQELREFIAQEQNLCRKCALISFLGALEETEHYSFIVDNDQALIPVGARISLARLYYAAYACIQ